MTQQPLVGRCFVKSDQQAVHSFSRQFLDVAQQYANRCEVGRFALGDLSFDLYTRKEIPVSSRLTKAFFSSREERPDYSLVIWEDLADLKLPVANWRSNLHYPLGQIDERISAPFRVAIDRHTGTISVYDTEQRLGAVWRSKLSELPYWSIATPFRVILSWFADQSGDEFFHTAAVSRDGRALLISGPSGSGKSTLSFFAALNGYELISDDFTLVRKNRAYAVYTRGKLHEGNAFFELVNGGISVEPGNSGEKRIIDLLVPPIRIARSAEICGVVLPIVTGLTAYARIRTAEAYRLVAPYSISGLLGGNRDSLKRISSLIKDFPAIRLALSDDPSENLSALDKIFAQL